MINVADYVISKINEIDPLPLKYDLLIYLCRE